MYLNIFYINFRFLIIQDITSGMLIISQAEKGPDQVFLPIKKCSLSSLSITSDYSGAHSESLGTFSPTVQQLVVSSDINILKPPLTVKQIMIIRKFAILNLKISILQNPKPTQYHEVTVYANNGSISKHCTNSSHKKASIYVL